MDRYIDIHTHTRNTGENLVLYNFKSSEVADIKNFTFGIHPWSLSEKTLDADFDRLLFYCEKRLIVAVGEIGIDRACNILLEKQIYWFRKQLELAENYRLPVIIHCVRAWSDLLEIRTKSNTNILWIFHGFNGSVKTAQQLIHKGCYLSFGHHLLINIKIQDIFKSLPIEYLFLETDTSNEKIESIYEKAAQLRSIRIPDLKMYFEKNFATVFKRH
jgi:TatD DNase family protein